MKRTSCLWIVMKYSFSLTLALTLFISVVMAHGGEDHDQSNQQETVSIINKQDQTTLTHINYTPYVLDLLLFITVIAFINLRYRNLAQKASKKAALIQTTPYAIISTMLLAGSVWAIHYVIPSSETNVNVVASAPITSTTNLNLDLVTVSKESQLLFGIRTEQTKLEKLISGLTVAGVVRMQSQNRAEVVPPISGRIKAMASFTIGSYIKQGQTLAVVEQVLSATDIANLEATRTDLRAKTAELQAQATQALTRRNAAEIEFERTKKLYDVGAIALKRVQDAELQLKLADEELKAANLRAEITQGGEKKIDSIKTFPLQAPISGLVIQSSLVSGAQVEAGKSILTIANLDHVWVEAQVFEKDINLVTSAKRAVFKTSAFPELNIQIGEGSNNRLLTLGTTIDPEKRTLAVTYEVTNIDGKLRDGMTAEITIDTSNNHEVVSVPKAAIVDEQGQKVVYVYNGGERFSKRIVKLGSEGQTSFEVISGLDAGERVAVTGLYQIQAGLSAK